ncbi:MAG TPA: 3-deoxy-8-phosphooctulonate synthase [Chlamydiales bacterium]|jgi:2-dehydro-3-deoxyphosphooctonate aldolase (KDO 8-P synthase)|nr:3-deoxy-8-phosphooctulonate synthase [Chlamydiales bacterium]
MQKTPIQDFFIGPGEPLVLISGPCIIESEEHTLRCAESLVKLLSPTSIRLIFKASYDKANRSSIHSFRGPGIDEGLKILQKVQKEFGLAVITDVHTPEEATIAGGICDMIQIPAFLSRQTDLILAAGSSNAAINVKKGQFLSPWEMKNVVDKLLSTGNKKILLTDRGTSFGYNNLVSDFRAIPIMQSFGFPVCFDASHSVQLPGGLDVMSGGQREFIPTLAKAAIASGCNALFIETHPDPQSAKSDAATVLSYQTLHSMLPILQKIYTAVQTPCLAI